MTEYLIAFNNEWVPDLTDEELREASKAVSALRTEMKSAGVLIFTGGLDDAAPVFSADASSGTPLFTDGPFAETKELRGCGRERSLWPAVGRRRCDVSDTQPPTRPPLSPPELPAATSSAFVVNVLIEADCKAASSLGA